MEPTADHVDHRHRQDSGLSPLRCCHSGMPRLIPAARATAIDTAKVAFEPSLDLFGVPSSSMSSASTASWSYGSALVSWAAR